MSVDKKVVEKMAYVARLSFSEEELEDLTSHLGKVLDYAKELDELDTNNVEPTPHGVMVSNVFREDQVKPSLPQDKVLDMAPDHEQGCFKVPIIIE